LARQIAKRIAVRGLISESAVSLENATTIFVVAGSRQMHLVPKVVNVKSS
jgi:hypothetical protein